MPRRTRWSPGEKISRNTLCEILPENMVYTIAWGTYSNEQLKLTYQIFDALTYRHGLSSHRMSPQGDAYVEMLSRDLMCRLVESLVEAGLWQKEGLGNTYARRSMSWIATYPAGTLDPVWISIQEWLERGRHA